MFISIMIEQKGRAGLPLRKFSHAGQKRQPAIDLSLLASNRGDVEVGSGWASEDVCRFT